MVVPDSTLIAEIILVGEGFNNTKVGLYYSRINLKFLKNVKCYI